MVRKISLNISDDSYKELASLSRYYKQDVEKIATSILRVVGGRAHSIITLSKECKVPVQLDVAIFRVLDAGFNAIHLLFNEILENLGVKGLYTVDELGIELDKHDLWFHFAGFVGSNLQVDDFFIHLELGGVTLTTYSYLELEKTTSEALRKLKELAERVEQPEEFGEVDQYDIEIDEDEGQLIFRISFLAESLDYLPSVNGISEFIKQVYEKAGIKKVQSSD